MDTLSARTSPCRDPLRAPGTARTDRCRCPFDSPNCSTMAIFTATSAIAGVRTLADAESYIQQGPAVSYARHGHGLYLVVRRRTRGQARHLRSDQARYPALLKTSAMPSCPPARSGLCHRSRARPLARWPRAARHQSWVGSPSSPRAMETLGPATRQAGAESGAKRVGLGAGGGGVPAAGGRRTRETCRVLATALGAGPCRLWRRRGEGGRRELRPVCIGRAASQAGKVS